MFEQFIRWIKTEIEPPPPWGAYHWAMLALTAAGMVALFALSPRLRERPRLVRVLTNCFGGLLLALEVFKQLFYSVHVGESGVYWEYPWHIFPWQFCSTPAYACLALFFLPKGRLRGYVCCFLGTYGAFGGATVLLHPHVVLIEYWFVNIHTMIWHMSLVLVGVLQWAGGTIPKTLRAFWGGTAVFALFALVALVLDFSLPQLAEEGFNMFFISPYAPCTILFLQELWQSAPYPVFLAVYLIGFAAIAAAIFAAVHGGYALAEIIRKRYRVYKEK